MTGSGSRPRDLAHGDVRGLDWSSVVCRQQCGGSLLLVCIRIIGTLAGWEIEFVLARIQWGVDIVVGKNGLERCRTLTNLNETCFKLCRNDLRTRNRSCIETEMPKATAIFAYYFLFFYLIIYFTPHPPTAHVIIQKNSCPRIFKFFSTPILVQAQILFFKLWYFLKNIKHLNV